MPLSSAALQASLAWALTRTNSGGYSPTTQGPDSLTFNLNTLNITTFNQVFSASYTIAVSGHQDIDLTSLTNFVNESIVFTAALLLIVIPTGAGCTVSPGPSNGLTWFFGGTSPTVTVPNGGGFLFTGAAAGPGGTVDGTHKVLRLTNAGAATLTVDVAIMGSA